MTTSSQPLLRAKALTLSYGGGGRAFTAVTDVSLELGDRSFLAVVGPSGSGKSSLLYMLSGLRTPTGGSVRFRGQDYGRLGDAGVTALRRGQFGFIFQQHFLINYLGCVENVLVGARPHDRGARARAISLLERLGLGTKLRHRPYQLSVGERQRVAVARAMVAEPAIIFADEPTASLDQHTGREVIDLLGDYRRQGAVMVVTHDLGMTAGCDQLLEMRDGAIRSPGRVPEAAGRR
jgi:putative ABC transport system ATP-binding protein